MQQFVRGLVIAFIITVLLIPTLLFAQGDLTLEGLAEQITSLTDRISKLEAFHTTVTVDGYCKLQSTSAIWIQRQSQNGKY